MGTRVSFYLACAYIIGTILWALTLLVSGMVKPLELAQALSSPLPWIVMVVLIGCAIGYFNYVTMPSIENGQYKKAVRQSFNVELLIISLYAVVEPVAVLAFHDWSSSALIVAGIFLGLAAVFAYAYPFLLQALQNMEQAYAGDVFAESIESGVSLNLKFGLVLTLLLVSNVAIVGATGMILPKIGVQNIGPRILGVMALSIFFSLM